MKMLKSKRSLLLFVVILAAILLAACGGGDDEPTATPVVVNTPMSDLATAVATITPITQDENVWERVREAGKIVVGTSADYPPFENYDDNFRIVGFDVDLITGMAELLQLEVEITDIAFDGLADALSLGQIDIAIAAISVTPVREEAVDFSHIYFISEDAYLAADDSIKGRIVGVNDLAVLRVGVQSGSVYETWLEQELVDTGLMPETQLHTYQQLQQALPDLEAGYIDVIALDKPPAELAVEEFDFYIAAEGLNRQRYSIAMAKGQTELRTRINQSLTTLQNNGVVADLVNEWMGLEEHEIIPIPSPTPTPAATAVPPPDSGCKDGMAYVADLNYDDNGMKNPPVIPPGQPFQKGWRIRNTGTCTWDSSYALTFVQGNRPGAQMGGQPTPIQGTVAPGQTYDIYVDFVAPLQPGVYQSFWQMQNGAGRNFGERIYVGITVPSQATPTPVPTQTPVPGISFWTDKDHIKSGECTDNHWRTENVQEVYYYRDGQNWQDHGVAGNGDRQECPTQTTNYNLRVVQRDNSVTTRTLSIYVEQAADAPRINYFTIEPTGSIPEGGCLNLRWEVTGAISNIRLIRNGNLLRENMPTRGSHTDCPPATGDKTYVLEAIGPGGTSKATQHIVVVPGQVTPTPPPSVPDPIIVAFVVQPTAIEPNQCVAIHWETGGGTVKNRITRNGAIVVDTGDLAGNAQDCLADPGGYEYILEASNSANVTNRSKVDVQVQAGEPPTATPEAATPTTEPPPEATPTPVPPEPTPEPPPTIDYLDVTSDGNTVVSQVPVGSCVIVTYGFSGSSLAAATLSRNGQVIEPDAVSPGGTEDCLNEVGTYTYTLKVDSEFVGSATSDASVEVVEAVVQPL